MEELKGFQRAYLSKKAHNLHPLVMIGQHGLSDAVVTATDDALAHHELIKVKFQDFKEERQSISRELAEKTDALLVSVIGNIAILFREAREPEKRNYRIPQQK